MIIRLSILYLFFCCTVANGENDLPKEFKIQFLESGKTITIHKGNFVQCVIFDSLNGEKFFYGKIREIRASGIELEKNSLLKESGGVINFVDIRNIEKINVTTRGIIPSLLAGAAIGQLLAIKQIPTAAVVPLIGVTVYIILVRAIKFRKKTLIENSVNHNIIIIPPLSDGGDDSYYR